MVGSNTALVVGGERVSVRASSNNNSTGGNRRNNNNT
jgi:hypothetical protein